MSTETNDYSFRSSGGNRLLITNIAFADNTSFIPITITTDIYKTVVLQARGGSFNLYNLGVAGDFFTLASTQAITLDVAKGKSEILCYAKANVAATVLEVLSIA